ncbi:MAG: molecular chaperone TorD family protein [Ignavibacteriae bacterium]|nr:molecular chaperone TorD family protein [Ignavibacteriota bacterium]
MNERVQMYDWFARMLSYPTNNTNLEIQHSVFNIHYSKISNNEYQILNVKGHLEKFYNAISNCSLSELEELYTRTFDINPIANLEIGWHLYGEQYERGEFLVMMRSLLREHAVEESSELPDHLTHVLLALGRMKKEEADAFAVKYVSPSIEKIVEAFGETENAYVHLLHAIKNFLEQQHQFNTSKYQPEVVAYE